MATSSDHWVVIKEDRSLWGMETAASSLFLLPKEGRKRDMNIPHAYPQLTKLADPNVTWVSVGDSAGTLFGREDRSLWGMHSEFKKPILVESGIKHAIHTSLMTYYIRSDGSLWKRNISNEHKQLFARGVKAFA